ncbi:MAG TPA: hypothetical protein VGG06_16925 [Thermoanaerobaculia bacterium]|jgi:hypothetical protein
MRPRYPDVRIRLHSRNPFALVSAVRQGLRRSHVDGREIDRFTEEALRVEEPQRMREICSAWAAIEIASQALR